VGSGLAFFRTTGYAVPKTIELEAISGWQWVFVTHVARRIAAADRPDDPSIPSPDEVDVAGFIDGYVARMPAALRRDLLRAFTYVEHVAPLGLGYLSRFTRLSPAEQDKVLALCHAVGASTYVNLSGGVDLYSHAAFRDQGIELIFIRAKPFEYAQFQHPFIPTLSIIDLMMFNPIETVKACISCNYELLQSGPPIIDARGHETLLSP